MTGSTTPPLPIDELIGRLRARAGDPDRRTSTRPSQFTAGLRTMDLGSMRTTGRSLADQLGRVVAANQEGRVDRAGHERALGLERSMRTPAPSALPVPADEAWIARVEAQLGVRLPAALRRVYGEVGDGGFGPGEGLLALSAVAAAYRDLRAPGAMPRGRSWPEGLLPLVSMDPGWDCVDAATGIVIAWDPEDLGARSSETAFARSFRELFGSVEAWLSDWVGSRTAAEAQADMMARFTSPEYQAGQARAAREALARMTPDERRAMGLPDEGWERVVWGGAGWEEPEPGR